MDRMIGRLAGFFAILGGGIMTAAALLVTVSVIMRWRGLGGVPGDFEIVQIAVAVSVFMFLPWCQWRSGNIVVDTFTGRLPERGRRALDTAWSLVLAGIAALICGCMMEGARETFGNGDSTMVSGFPLWPGVALCALLAGLLALTAVTTALRTLRGSP